MISIITKSQFLQLQGVLSRYQAAEAVATLKITRELTTLNILVLAIGTIL